MENNKHFDIEKMFYIGKTIEAKICYSKKNGFFAKINNFETIKTRIVFDTLLTEANIHETWSFTIIDNDGITLDIEPIKAVKSRFEKIIYNIGDAIDLYFMKNIKNEKGRPVARTDDGIICIIDYNFKGFISPNSCWKCEIKIVDNNRLIVFPIIMLKSAKTVNEETINLAKKFNVEHIDKPSPKTLTLKKGYLYKTKQEIVLNR